MVSFERAGWNADIVLGSAILSLPEFTALFSTEAPATGVELTIGALTILFSDLTGTTALYERLGDAAAFALVQEHFAAVSAAVERHRGVVVKTMGDAVMATFTSPADALSASLDMTGEVAHLAESRNLAELAIKIGLHEGPCLIVQANGWLDFFGSTVNLASRLQHQARPNHIVLGADLLSHGAVARVVARVVADRAALVEQFRAELKGVSGLRALLSIKGTAR